MRTDTQPEDAELARFYRASRREAEEILDGWVRPRTANAPAGEYRDLIRGVIGGKLRSSGLTWGGGRTLESEIEDLTQDALLQLVSKMRESRTSGDPVRSPRAYARTIATQHCDEFFRHVFRIRYNVSKRIEAQLRQGIDFYQYTAPAGQRYGSFTKWAPPPQMSLPERAQEIEANPVGAVNRMFVLFPYDVTASDGLPTTKQCMSSALSWAQGALLFDHLVATLQAARNEYDSTDRSIDGPGPDIEAPNEIEPFDDGPSAILTFWLAFKKLKKELAKALIFNLEGAGEGQLAELLAAIGVTSLGELGEFLGYDPQVFAEEIVPSLPWTNPQIGAELNATAAQVATYRNVAKTALAHYAAQICEDSDALRGVMRILGRASHQEKTRRPAPQ